MSEWHCRSECASVCFCKRCVRESVRLRVPAVRACVKREKLFFVLFSNMYPCRLANLPASSLWIALADYQAATTTYL